MARFKKVHAPAYVSAYRPGIDQTPPWSKSPNVTKKMLKACNPGDWLVCDDKFFIRYDKADFAKKFVHDA